MNRVLQRNYTMKLNRYAKEKNDQAHQHQEQFDRLYDKYQKELEDEKKEITEHAAKSLHQQGEWYAQKFREFQEHKEQEIKRIRSDTLRENTELKEQLLAYKSVALK